MYTLKDLIMITGLTERTLRNYLKLGILVGEKKDGIWCFGVEQIEELMQNETVRAAMHAKRQAIVFDFLNATKKKENSICVILDLPKDDAKEVSRFFCEAVSCRRGLEMSFESKKGNNRVILKGGEETVLDILREYRTRT